MLHRNFKSAKCKTSLKLASSRIKLLKNKREAQVRQLKRELAQLLESGQDQTARIRVEHVVREEKTLAAYDLLEIYCELIVARLPIIESQKNCPIDLKEAISSVIFASPRCADVPELMEVRKHFTVKYGKDFISAAVEVRPDCGVSRLLIEKLSAKAPDGPTKIKILTAIAEEHNINWEPKSFGEKDSKHSEDLLNGPSMFTNSSQMFVNSPDVHAPHDFDDKRNTNFHVSPKNNENHGAPTNFQEHKLTQSSSSQAEIGANKTNPSAFHPTGSGVERMEFRHSYSGDRNVSSMGRQNWNMEFKDATAAAQAAAESAERASLAARAAADLASRGNSTWQYSTETRRDEEMNRYGDSSLRNEYYAKGPVNIVHGINSRMDYEKISSNKQDDVTGISENIHWDNLKSNTESRQSASLKSSAASGDGPSLVNHLKMDDKYSRKSSSESGKTHHLTDIGLERQSTRPDLDYTNKLQGLDCKAVDDCEEAMVRKQSKQASSRLPSSKFSDDQHVTHSNSQSLESDADENPFAVHDEGIIRTSRLPSSKFSDDQHVRHSNSQSLESDADENPFSVHDEGIIRRNSYRKTSDTADIIYDHYVSDPDECRIDLEAQHKEGEDLHFSSRRTESPTDIFANKNTWSERRNVDESLEKSISRPHFSTEHQFDPVFSRSWTSSTVASQPDEMLPATFDDYDAPISKETEDLNKSELVRSRDSNAANLYPKTSQVTSKVTQGESHGFTSSFLDEGVRGSNKQWLQSSSFDKNHVEVHSSRNHGIGINAGSARKFGYDNATTNQASPKVSPTILDLDDPDSCSQQVDEGKHGQSQLPSRFSVGYQVRGNAPTPLQDEHVEETESSEDSNLEIGKGLNYPKVTGGFRNKGYTRPPYVKNPLHSASSSKQTAADTSAKFEESFSAAEVSGSTGARIQDPYYKDVREDVDRRPSTRTYSEPHDDDSLDELQLQTSTITQDQYNKKNGIEINKKSSSRTPYKYFDSTDSDSEGDSPVEASTNKARFNTGLSQRTKASRTNSKESFSKATMLSEASGSPNYGEERNSSAKSSFSNQPSQRPPSQNKISGGFGNPDQPRLDKEAAVNPVQESKSYFGDRMKLSAKEQSSNLNPPEKEPPSNSLRKKVTSGNIENLNNPSSSGQSPSKERATHVHPKLPDYDALAAHLHSLRKTRH